MRIRTGYSFRTAVGDIDDVMSRIKECEYPVAPISDRDSTFGYVKWRKAAKKAEMRPVYGVEINVTDSISAKKPNVDAWTFFAIDSLAPLNRLFQLATQQSHYTPLLTYEQACAADGVFKLAGKRPRLDLMSVRDDLFMALSPSTPRGLLKAAVDKGYLFVASSDNYYPRAEDKHLYEVLIGRTASAQTYPQYILTPEEWNKSLSWVDPAIRVFALQNQRTMMEACKAEMVQGVLLKPVKTKTLRELCIEGAAAIGCDLSRSQYAARLDKELALIDEKQYEDYFFIIADIMQWARERMICGPARGSSCGSLVCYLLQITTVDPIPYGLIFQRFIDTTRTDLPDIDLDFSDERRQLVFDYMVAKYGADRVARLGTVALYKPRSSIAEAGAALEIPRWKTDKVLDSIIDRSSGDSRALQIMEDTFNDTPAGKELIEEFPELRITQQMEGHPRHASQHAAGIVLTQDPVVNYIAIDSRTGATQCDKKDAEELNLLKIDALGLTQLSVFEDTLQMAGLPLHHLETVPLDDEAAFDVINKGRFSGVFQYNGIALQSIANQIRTESLEDIISTTALARPGPMASGQTNEWVKRKRGDKPVSYPHPAFEPYLEGTSGIICYQETIMQIGKELGDLSWEDVTTLRKSMSKSLGKEYFDKFGDKWKAGAIKKGIPKEVLDAVWDNMTSFGAWCLSGDTVLRNPHNNQFSKPEFTIAELYNANGLAPDKKQKSGKRQKIFMWDGKGLKPSTTIAITYSGSKETFTIVTRSGKSIRATKDHRFLTADGTYRAVMDLHIGDNLMIIGGRQLTGFGIKPDGIISISRYGIEPTYDIAMPNPHNNFLANDIVVHNCFNRSHAVAYGIVSYWCCWLKAHHPFEFAAATLQHETDSLKQIQLLREMHAEGIKYIPVDKDISTDRWQASYIDNEKVLVGPVQNVKGIGPKITAQIVSARHRGEPLPSRAEKLLTDPKTNIDSLWPISDAINKLMPDPKERNIYSIPARVIDVQTNGTEYEVMVIGVAKQIKPKDENEAVNVAKRGYKISGPTNALNLWIMDDTDTIYCKVNRYKFLELGKEIVDRGAPGRAIYAVKGTVPRDFRMINIQQVRYIGMMDSNVVIGEKDNGLNKLKAGEQE